MSFKIINCRHINVIIKKKKYWYTSKHKKLIRKECLIFILYSLIKKKKTNLVNAWSISEGSEIQEAVNHTRLYSPFWSRIWLILNYGNQYLTFLY